MGRYVCVIRTMMVILFVMMGYCCCALHPRDTSRLSMVDIVKAVYHLSYNVFTNLKKCLEIEYILDCTKCAKASEATQYCSCVSMSTVYYMSGMCVCVSEAHYNSFPKTGTPEGNGNPRQFESFKTQGTTFSVCTQCSQTIQTEHRAGSQNNESFIHRNTTSITGGGIP